MADLQTFIMKYVCVLVAQLYPTLCDPRHYSPLGSSVHGIFQPRILEWVAISSPGEMKYNAINKRKIPITAENNYK